MKKSIKDFIRIQKNHIYYIYIKLLVQVSTFLFKIEFLHAYTILKTIYKFKKHF